MTANINIAKGLKISSIGLTLTFCKNSKSKLCAQFSLSDTSEIITEIPVNTWHEINSAICTFLYLNGEEEEGIQERVQIFLSKFFFEKSK